MGRIFVKDKRFYTMLLSLAVPIAAQQLITVGVNMADNVMLGQLGEVSMSAATLANNFIGIYQIMCMGLSMGASVLTSRYFGMGDKNGMKKAANLMFRLELIIATLFAVATILLPSGIMSMYTSDAGIISQGRGYLLISTACYYLNGYAITTSVLLRSVGKANVPLISSICSFFINIFFNWVFIFGNLGAPEMGVNGAALGTLLARIVEFCVTMGYLLFKDKNMSLRVKDLTMHCGDLIPEYIRISIPVLISDSLLGIGNSMVAVVMGHIGAVYVAANAITTVLSQLATVVIQGISQSSCTITGITLGEGDTEKAQRQGITFAALGIIIGAIGCVLILCLKNTVIGFYNISDETASLAGELIDALGFIIMFQCANSILTKGVLRGGGDTRFLMVADILFLWIGSIPLGALAGLVWHLPGFWISICLRIDQFIKAVWCICRLMSGKWIKKISSTKQPVPDKT